eukprot:TRINITY_DN8973_c0_g1_i1.p1 TRINITY_DN8973_c0_g1~~TRINITY_DN8973_c0_g1_i1.p1  ORF type:complete len:443 (-),score=67.97 TRINITY_DN8973_c0_g1_i1:44-1372(-)
MDDVERQIEGPGKQSALNRLGRAARLGFGPLAKALPDKYGRRSRSRSPQGSFSEERWKVKPDPRLLREKEEHDMDDVRGFLAPKTVTGSGRTAVATPPTARQQIQFPSQAAVRLPTFQTGARAKTAARPPSAVVTACATQEGSGQGADESVKAEPKVEGLLERMQRRPPPTLEPEPSDDEDDEDAPAPVGDGDDEPRSKEESEADRRKEERRKRDEWRRKWKEERLRVTEQRGGRARDESSDTDDRERRRIITKEKNDAQSRANLWRSINNDGRVYNRSGRTDGDVGQMTDRELDKRLSELQKSSTSERLMSEEEVMAKIRTGTLKSKKAAWTEERRKSRTRSRSPHRDKTRRSTASPPREKTSRRAASSSPSPSPRERDREQPVPSRSSRGRKRGNVSSSPARRATSSSPAKRSRSRSASASRERERVRQASRSRGRARRR